MINTNYHRVIITGFRATGKTTLGKKLAAAILWDFIDLDDYIQKNSGQTIAEITNNGQQWVKFRQLEQQALEDVLKKKRVVVACGGGVGVNDVTMAEKEQTYGQLNASLLKKSARTLTVGLWASKETIARNLKQDGLTKNQKQRPTLAANKSLKKISNPQTQNSLKDLIEENLKLYTKRQPLYQALTPHQIETSKWLPQKIIDDMIALMKD